MKKVLCLTSALSILFPFLIHYFFSSFALGLFQFSLIYPTLFVVALLVVRHSRVWFEYILASWLAATIMMGGCLGLELSLKHFQKQWPNDLSRYYLPFSVQHLHPLYFFYFPLDAAQIATNNNSVCSIDKRGFRGALPEEAGDRKLAFIVGGSSVFGYGNTGNEKTISGFLNQIQKKYLFVNAGVPSWNSTQQFNRICFDLLKYRPALIVVYDGFNDAIIGYRYRNQTLYPGGSPESFDLFESTTKKNQSNPLLVLNPNGWRSLLVAVPHLTKKIFEFKRRILQGKQIKSFEADNTELDVAKAVDAYVWNHNLIRNIAHSFQVKTLFFLQPIYYLHKTSYEENGNIFNKSSGEMSFLRGFCAKVNEMNRKNGDQLIDFSNIFDGIDEERLLKSRFIDQVHTDDEGNKYIAEKMLKQLSLHKLL